MPNLVRKKGRGSSNKTVTPRKKFKGNQYTLDKDTTFASTSAEKLKKSDFNEVDVDPSSAYVILNFAMVFDFLTNILQCKDCKSDVKFSRTAQRGLGFKLTVTCDCHEYCIGSSPLVDKVYEVNRRILFVLRLCGLGMQSINIFCNFMELSAGFSKNLYYSTLENLHIVSKAVFDVVRTGAVSEEIQKNEAAGNEPTHLSVSGDGTWKKRGFSSLFGVSSLIGKYSKKVLDVSVKSSFCQSCNLQKDAEDFDEWYETHKENCGINHEGSAGKMEVDAIKEMFLRSEKLLGVKYKYYIGDGDTKTFKGLLDIQPYPDLSIEKKECVGHVEKRMGTRLRNAKKEHKGIGGKGQGKLTDKVIKNLTIYYGLAIRRNSTSLEDMKKAIWATFYHMISTNDEPQHDYCPAGEDSWCSWRVAEALGELDEYQHNPPLAPAVQEALLRRCLGGNSQNSNESLNACIWKLAPKHLHCGVKTIEIATYIAVSIFNEGYISVLKMMTSMGLTIGPYAHSFAKNMDDRRILSAERNMTPAARAAILEQRTKQIQQNLMFEEEEGILYGPGIAD